MLQENVLHSDGTSVHPRECIHLDELRRSTEKAFEIRFSFPSRLDLFTTFRDKIVTRYEPREVVVKKYRLKESHSMFISIGN